MKIPLNARHIRDRLTPISPPSSRGDFFDASGTPEFFRQGVIRSRRARGRGLPEGRPRAPPEGAPGGPELLKPQSAKDPGGPGRGGLPPGTKWASSPRRAPKPAQHGSGCRVQERPGSPRGRLDARRDAGPKTLPVRPGALGVFSGPDTRVFRPPEGEAPPRSHYGRPDQACHAGSAGPDGVAQEPTSGLNAAERRVSAPLNGLTSGGL